MVQSRSEKCSLPFLFQILQKERQEKEKNGEVKHRSRKTFKKVFKPIIERTEKRKRLISSILVKWVTA